MEPVREGFGRGFLIDRDTGFSRTGSVPGLTNPKLGIGAGFQAEQFRPH